MSTTSKKNVNVPTTTQISNYLKKHPSGDISTYRAGFFDGARWVGQPKKEEDHEQSKTKPNSI